MQCGCFPAITAAIGEQVGAAAAKGLGVTNHHVSNSMAAGGSIAAGATAGALCGGPVGAAAGATMGAVSYTAGIAVNAIVNTGMGARGPNDNWCYVEISTGNKRVCVGTYGGSDTIYFHTYWKEYAIEKSLVMSAGQKQTDGF